MMTTSTKIMGTWLHSLYSELGTGLCHSFGIAVYKVIEIVVYNTRDFEILNPLFLDCILLNFTGLQ